MSKKQPFLQKIYFAKKDAFASFLIKKNKLREEKIIVNEEWRSVIGYEGLYEISSLGKVKRVGRFGNNGKFLSPRQLHSFNDKNNYKRVNLWKNGHMKQYPIHRLVANAFIPNPYRHPCVNHLDENKANNVVDNLEWCSFARNNSWGIRGARISKKKCIPIIQFDKKGNKLHRFESCIAAAKFIGVSKSAICDCLKGRTKTCSGYIWQYEKVVFR